MQRAAPADAIALAHQREMVESSGAIAAARMKKEVLELKHEHEEEMRRLGTEHMEHRNMMDTRQAELEAKHEAMMARLKNDQKERDEVMDKRVKEQGKRLDVLQKLNEEMEKKYLAQLRILSDDLAKATVKTERADKAAQDFDDLAKLNSSEAARLRGLLEARDVTLDLVSDELGVARAELGVARAELVRLRAVPLAVAVVVEGAPSVVPVPQPKEMMINADGSVMG